MNILGPPLDSVPLPEIYNFGRGLPGLHNYEFSFSYRCVGVEKILENCQILTILPCPYGARVMKLIIYVLLTPKLHHTKFE